MHPMIYVIIAEQGPPPNLNVSLSKEMRGDIVNAY